jgi:hypothetical protein
LKKKVSMRNAANESSAIARFALFVSNLPRLVDENAILQYHGIIKLLEEAYMMDLSQFRIPADRVDHAAKNAMSVPRSAGWQTRRSKRTLVEFTYFRGRVRSLVGHLKAALRSRPN